MSEPYSVVHLYMSSEGGGGCQEQNVALLCYVSQSMNSTAQFLFSVWDGPLDLFQVVLSPADNVESLSRC